jgi:hypothetical protein
MRDLPLHDGGIMHGRLASFALLLLSVLAVASCAKSTEPTFSDIAGVYRLRIAPGASLVLKPEPRSTSTVNVTQATLDLDPVWRFSLHYTITSGSESVGVSFSGNYMEVGSLVSLLYDSGASRSGTLSGGTITVTTEDGQTLVFEKVG